MAQIQTQPNCLTAPVGYATCFSLLSSNPNAQSGSVSSTNIAGSTQRACPSTTTGGTGTGSSQAIGDCGAYNPFEIEAAYNLTSYSANKGKGIVIGIVNAGDDTTAEADMNTYRSFYGLPPCTSANGCFHKVNEQGIPSAYPGVIPGWPQETSIDLDMVSAICPNCQIVLVEANSNSWGDLGVSVNTAYNFGAVAISNSYGGAEGSATTPNYTLGEAAYYNHPGVGIFAASGDSGYGVSQKGESAGSGLAFPTILPTVTSVGGTSLNQTVGPTTRDVISETAWDSGGSGCSQTKPKPSWQIDSGCADRTATDVSAVADIGTPVWVNYAGTWYNGGGGTSVATPIIASTVALRDKHYFYTPSLAYTNRASFNDIVSGSNGTCGSYLCTARTGYDGPTGVGTPNGIAGFADSSIGDVPSVSINSPALGANKVSGNFTVSGTASDISSTVSTVAISVDHGSYKTITGTANWTTTLSASTLSVGLHNLTVKATNAKGASSIDSIGILAGNNIPPNPPSQVTATSTGASTVSINWTAATDTSGTIASYNVYRDGVNPIQGYEVNTKIASGVKTTTFSDSGLLPSTLYSYSVSAVDTNGLESPLSTSSSVTTQSKTGNPPTAPTVSLVSSNGGSVTISWTPSQSTIGIASYNVSRSSDPNQNGVNLPGTTLSYTDTSVLPGTQYTYNVSATDLNGTFSPFGTITITTPTTIPPPPPITQPTGLIASAISYTQINLAWNASTGGQGGPHYYAVYVNGTRLSNNVSALSVNNGTQSFADAINILPLTKYSFYVVAYDYAGNHSIASNTVTVTTPAKYNVSVLTGKVIDSSTSKALSGVQITATSSTNQVSSASTNSLGIYSFSKLPSGVNTLVFKATGYKTKTVDLTLGIVYTKTYNVSLVKI
ncbi:MAG TPA: fibronectin type III domain-containing protein [Patescibacteria group bacterium]|nr:fibronectin type III domain-containing protein [Patescibacteria group bacterium]